MELQRFVDSKDSGHPLYAHFRQDNPKKGNKHEATYDKYKSVVTVDDYLACKALGTKKQHVRAGHFIHDLQRGWVVITDSLDCTAFSVVTVDMEKVVKATLAQDPLNYVIMAKEHPDIVHKYYEFSTGENNNLETMLEDTQELLQKLLQGGDASALHAGLVKHVHANATIGEENTHHKKFVRILRNGYGTRDRMWQGHPRERQRGKSIARMELKLAPGSETGNRGT